MSRRTLNLAHGELSGRVSQSKERRKGGTPAKSSLVAGAPDEVNQAILGFLSGLDGG